LYFLIHIYNLIGDVLRFRTTAHHFAVPVHIVECLTISMTHAGHVFVLGYPVVTRTKITGWFLCVGYIAQTRTISMPCFVTTHLFDALAPLKVVAVAVVVGSTDGPFHRCNPTRRSALLRIDTDAFAIFGDGAFTVGGTETWGPLGCTGVVPGGI
jgi:hypothetical protein